MMAGGCLCGRVRYQAEGELADMHHCHCSMCRKQHGAAFSIFGAVPAERFRWNSGEERLRHYQGPHVRRTFCGTCGSTLTAVDHRSPNLVWIAAGTLDDDPGAASVSRTRGLEGPVVRDPRHPPAVRNDARGLKLKPQV